MLAFSAHKVQILPRPPYRVVRNKVFAATQMTVEEREKRCRKWLDEDMQDESPADSGDESTEAQML